MSSQGQGTRRVTALLRELTGWLKKSYKVFSTLLSFMNGGLISCKSSPLLYVFLRAVQLSLAHTSWCMVGIQFYPDISLCYLVIRFMNQVFNNLLWPYSASRNSLINHLERLEKTCARWMLKYVKQSRRVNLKLSPICNLVNSFLLNLVIRLRS